MRVIVRKGAAADAPALAALRLRWHAEQGGAPVAHGRTYLDSFAAWISDHESTHLPFLAEVGGAVAGMAWLMIAERVPDPARPLRLFGDVQSVFVVPELRDQRVGAALLEVVLAEAGNRGLEHVTVHASERAVPFYRRGGFRHGRQWLSWRPE
jgi:GNAT superfamily N-acetyltransferase